MSKSITYQNKDVLSKLFVEYFKDISLKVYGLDLPPIKRFLPTNLPSVQLSEKRADNIFLLEDDTILLLEYESSNDRKNLLKYGHYAFRIMETHYKEDYHKIIIVVIYTGDVQSAHNNLDMGSLKLGIEQVFLSQYDGHKMFDELQAKVLNNEPLSDEDVMKFIILPLTEKQNKQGFIEKTIDLAKSIADENKQLFIIAGIISATDKFIDNDYSNSIKEWLNMTKVARLYEEEKIEYGNKIEEATRETTREETREEIARKMLSKGKDILEIMELTGLSKDVLLSLKA